MHYKYKHFFTVKGNITLSPENHIKKGIFLKVYFQSLKSRKYKVLLLYEIFNEQTMINMLFPWKLSKHTESNMGYSAKL